MRALGLGDCWPQRRIVSAEWLHVLLVSRVFDEIDVSCESNNESMMNVDDLKEGCGGGEQSRVEVESEK